MKGTSVDDAGRPLLRHTLATLAYRGGKTLRGVPPGLAFGCGGRCATGSREFLRNGVGGESSREVRS